MAGVAASMGGREARLKAACLCNERSPGRGGAQNDKCRPPRVIPLASSPGRLPVRLQMQKLQSSISGRSSVGAAAHSPGATAYASSRLNKSTTQKMAAKYGQVSCRWVGNSEGRGCVGCHAGRCCMWMERVQCWQAGTDPPQFLARPASLPAVRVGVPAEGLVLKTHREVRRGGCGERMSGRQPAARPSISSTIFHLPMLYCMYVCWFRAPSARCGPRTAVLPVLAALNLSPVPLWYLPGAPVPP